LHRDLVRSDAARRSLRSSGVPARRLRLSVAKPQVRGGTTCPIRHNYLPAKNLPSVPVPGNWLCLARFGPAWCQTSASQACPIRAGIGFVWTTASAERNERRRKKRTGERSRAGRQAISLSSSLFVSFGSTIIRHSAVLCLLPSVHSRPSRLFSMLLYSVALLSYRYVCSLSSKFRPVRDIRDDLRLIRFFRTSSQRHGASHAVLRDTGKKRGGSEAKLNARFRRGVESPNAISRVWGPFLAGELSDRPWAEGLL
jgi:hypothetical protein